MTTPNTTHTGEGRPLELHDILARLQYQGGNTPNERNRANRRATEEVEALLQRAYERGKADGAVEENQRYLNNIIASENREIDPGEISAASFGSAGAAITKLAWKHAFEYRLSQLQRGGQSE